MFEGEERREGTGEGGDGLGREGHVYVLSHIPIPS